MSYLSEEQITALQEIADANDGHCDRCTRIIRIYRYPVNKQMATVLRKMIGVVDRTGSNEINFDDFELPYSLKTQRTKMRLHGLIRQVERDNVKVQNTWLITKKGGDFLRGEPIPRVVVAFDNQVLGHDGGTTTIHRVMDEAAFQQDSITPAEAAVYSNVRDPKKYLTYQAIFKGSSHSKAQYQTNTTHDIKIDRLQVGRPVIVIEPHRREYKDLAAFQRDWQIV